MLTKKPAWIVLIVLAISIKIFSLFPDAVEEYYSNGIYPFISQIQRILFGWIPFSIGDIFYGAIVLAFLYKTWVFIKRIYRGEVNRQYSLNTLRVLLFFLLCLYTAFNLLWGLNYNRRGIAYQLQLGKDKHSKEDLIEVMQQLTYRLNALDSAARLNRLSLEKKRNLFREAILSYENLSKQNILFTYDHKSVKPSLFSYLGNWLGYTGYYNPISGEAQVNTTVPLFIQPFTTCHEIGHQLGYAKENEANFAGFLSARVSENPSFRYSVYFDLYIYGRLYLYWQDSLQLKRLDSSLHKGVKQDYKELRDFSRKHENPLEKLIDRLYGQYLKANEQPAGKMTYGQVINWLIAYYKKNGTI